MQMTRCVSPILPNAKTNQTSGRYSYQEKANFSSCNCVKRKKNSFIIIKKIIKLTERRTLKIN